MGPSNEKAVPNKDDALSSISASGPSSSTAGAKISAPDYIPQITDALDKLTTQAASLPPKSDLSFHRTLDRKFAKSLDVTSSKLLVLTERLLRLVETTPGPSGVKAAASKGKGRSALVDEEDAVEGFRRSVGNVIDGLLEDADSRLDEMSGQKKTSAIKVDPILAASASRKLPGPFAPFDPSSSSSTSKKSRLPWEMMSADIPKPQLAFSDTVDNTPNRPWTPSLTEKTHAMVPLSHPISTADIPSPESAPDPKQAEIRKKRKKERNHPYWFETQHLPYPTRMFEILPPIPPVSLEESPLIFVDTPESLNEMVGFLKEAKEIAVDLEHHSNRSYFGFTCLMQISTREKDWVVDTLKLRGELREGKLGGVMTDPNVVKVFHGADSDIVWLQKDFDIYIVNLFDTYHATKVLNFNSHSLASLLARYSSFTADKRYQMADWRIRPLPQEMIDYARSDTHYLLNIYDHLRNALLEMSSRPSTPQPLDTPDPLSGTGISTPRQNPQAALRRTLELSAETALRTYEKEEYMFDGTGPGGWKVILKKHFPRGSEGSIEVAVVKALHAWRDTLARELDESPYYIMPNDVLYQISVLRIPNREVIERLVRKRKMAAGKYVNDILDLAIETRKTYRSPSPPAGTSTSSTIQSAPKPSFSAISRTIATTNTPLPGSSTVKADFDSLWSSLTVPTPSSEYSAPKPKAKSSLFGNTVRQPSSSSGPKAAFGLGKPKSSALFGSSLPSSSSTARAKKEGSPTFDVVRRRILDAINPGGLLVDMNNEPDSSSSSTVPKSVPGEDRRGTVQPETVPFVPANKRTGFLALKEIAQKSRIAVAAEKSTVFEQDEAVEAKTSSEPVTVNSTEGKKGKDEIVKVKRQKQKGTKKSIEVDAGTNGVVEIGDAGESSSSAKKRARSATTTSTLPPSSAAYSTDSAPAHSKDLHLGLPPHPTPTGSKKKNKKAKLAAADIPTFDYSTEGNLLDHPSSAPRDEQAEGSKKQKKKKDKKAKLDAPPAMMIETPNFGKMPRDMTQPKAGARSKTFTS